MAKNKIDDTERYQRNQNTLSPDDQKRLKDARVCILGLGGLGGGVCELLARIGVGHLVLVDGDTFDVSNLNRQLLSQESLIGKPKAQAAKNRVGAVNSSVRVTCFDTFATPETLDEILDGADLVVDCLDTIDARFMAQKAAGEKNIPLVSGAIAGVTGQVTVIFPGDPGFELIYGSLASDTDAGGGQAHRGIETQTGNLAHCAIFVGALQVSEVLKVLLGKGEVLRNKLLIADLWTNTVETITLV